MAEITVDMNAVAQHSAQIGLLGGLLGGKYFTMESKETWTDFENDQLSVSQNPDSPVLIINRSPRKFEIRDFDVLTQSIKTNPLTKVTSVVFNPGTKTEAEASIVAGNALTPITEDRIKAAITPGAPKQIFADGRKLLDVVNTANQQNIDLIDALMTKLQSQKDSIISTMNANKNKVNAYYEALVKSKKELNNADNGSSVEVIISRG